jgi:hypothetical protein
MNGLAGEISERILLSAVRAPKMQRTDAKVAPAVQERACYTWRKNTKTRPDGIPGGFCAFARLWLKLLKKRHFARVAARHIICREPNAPEGFSFRGRATERTSYEELP